MDEQSMWIRWQSSLVILSTEVKEKKDLSPQKMHAIATYLYDKVELNSKKHTPYMQALFDLYRAWVILDTNILYIFFHRFVDEFPWYFYLYLFHKSSQPFVTT